ncbi:hypothetical protein BX616_002436 [Lobosporangium transversale]|uniref:Ser-Thr-rich glycosyl-phosphatidyl-inositol-anchored membrane family-domain-containing protein n=1 Tax=Lobosporangium transversale TaxID=64571 RepID=A0A1Y2GH11_9FUNG|nr:hypothetical protein BCR41DRAFT_410036 [Lobosporangium transversale]KAF9900953.1 hypothetical protein BX616_002436 [Lobosporangium transversale]ORZ10647.1 hypothetical protein BCR41DRAFT_410036 [Lobosporangium transversale]|eukprot:XP_021879368.1 hypothetical protein BCR41DRAFT_410036 [Lobosporangium transversale]
MILKSIINLLALVATATTVLADGAAIPPSVDATPATPATPAAPAPPSTGSTTLDAPGGNKSPSGPPDHISFTQPVGDGIAYAAGTNQTFSWSMACTPPSTLVSATPNETEVDFMDSNNIDNAFYVKKVGTIDCTKMVGNLVWTVPADTKAGTYALQLLLSPKNAYSGRFQVKAPGETGSTNTNVNSKAVGTTTSGANTNMIGSTVVTIVLAVVAGVALVL